MTPVFFGSAMQLRRLQELVCVCVCVRNACAHCWGAVCYLATCVSVSVCVCRCVCVGVCVSLVCTAVCSLAICALLRYKLQATKISCRLHV